MAAAVEEMALPVMKYTYSPGKLLCHLEVLIYHPVPSNDACIVNTFKENLFKNSIGKSQREMVARAT